MNAYHVPVKNGCDSATKMIVVADGDIATNLINPIWTHAHGYNFYTSYTFQQNFYQLFDILSTLRASSKASKDFTCLLT
jgi:hypothetical protein